MKFPNQYKICNQEIEHIKVESGLWNIIEEEPMLDEEYLYTKVHVANSLVVRIRPAFTFLDGQTLKN